MSIQESLTEVWAGGGLLQRWGHWVRQWVYGTFWRRSPLSSLLLLLLSHFSRVRLVWPYRRQARTLEWVAISFSNAWKWKVKVKSFSRVRPSGTPWTAAFQAPPSMGFSRQEYWSGVPLPYLNYLHHSLAPGPTTRREHSPAHQQKIRLKIYWAWSHPSEQDPVSPSVSLSHQEASISLLPLSIRGQTEWKPQSQKTKQTDHMYHSLV